MAFSSENLLRELDQPEIIDWAPELKNRKEAYAFLMAAVRGDQLSLMQFLNALHALYHLAFPENVDGVLETIVEVCRHPNVLIRSEALQLAIGIVTVSARLTKPVRFTEAQEATLRAAIAKGLRTPIDDRARDYLDRSGAQRDAYAAMGARLAALSELDELYVRFLHVGFLVLRKAVDSGDRVWLDAEVQLLHGVPGLVGDINIERHRHFWFEERGYYIDKLAAHGAQEPLSCMRTFYEPLWEQMEPVMLRELEDTNT